MVVFVSGVSSNEPMPPLSGFGTAPAPTYTLPSPALTRVQPIEHPTQSVDCQKHSEDSRQKVRPDDEKPGQGALKPEEPKQPLVSQGIGHCSGGVSSDHKPAENDYLTVRPSRASNMPATLALKRGDAPAIRFIIS